MSEDTKRREDILSLGKLTSQRMATYGLISRMYRSEMDEATLGEMKKMLFPASTGNDNVDKGFKLITTYLGRTWEYSLTELAVDYVRAFVGDTNELDGAAFPYESVYTSEKHLVMQMARDEVLAIYRSYGMKKDDEWKDPEDHIAVELEFMKVVCLRIGEAFEAGDEDGARELLATQLNFLDDHLLSWTPLLTSDMRHFAKTDFYIGLSYLTDGYLETDREFLTDLLVYAEGR